jgi:hypothetical protein
MKRAELRVGQRVVTNTYGTRGTVVDLAAWETPGTWSQGFRLTKEQHDDAQARGFESGLARLSQTPSGTFFAGLRRLPGGKGSTILVQLDNGRLESVGLSAVRDGGEVDREQQAARERRQELEAQLSATAERIRKLPRALSAGPAYTLGGYGRPSQQRVGAVSLSLDALEDLVHAADVLSQLIAAGHVDAQTVEEVEA